MRSTRSIRLMVWPVLVALLLAACGTSATSTPEASQPAESTAPQQSTGESSEPTPAGIGTPEVTDLTLGVSGTGSIGGIVAIMAGELDPWSECGLNVTVTHFEGDSQNAQAMAAGQVDAIDASGLPIITSLKTDRPLVTTFVNHANLSDVLVVSPDINDASDLKGKSVAVSGFGALSHGQVIIALQSIGLSASDVTITPIGGGSARAAALEGGSVQAAPLDPGEALAMEPLGFKVLVDIGKIPGAGLQRSGISVTQEFADQNPNATLCLTYGYAKMLGLLMSDPSRAAEVYAGYMDVDIQDAVDGLQSEFSFGWVPLDGRGELKWYDAAKEALLAVDPELEGVDPADAFTNEFVDQLDQMGLLAKAGLPPANGVPTEVPMP